MRPRPEAGARDGGAATWAVLPFVWSTPWEQLHNALVAIVRGGQVSTRILQMLSRRVISSA